MLQRRCSRVWAPRLRAIGRQHWYGETAEMQVTYRDKAWTFDRRLTVMQMFKLIEVLPETVLVVRNGQLIAEDQQPCARGLGESRLRDLGGLARTRA